MGKDKFVFKKEFLLYHDSAWYDGINNNIGEKESMQKIQKPKRMKYSKEDLIFEEAGPQKEEDLLPQIRKYIRKIP